MASGATCSGARPICTRSTAHLPSTSFIIGSPQPVGETAALALSAKQPQPISDESPTRPGALFSVPPVEVPAAILPPASSATAPTVSCDDASYPVSRDDAS